MGDGGPWLALGLWIWGSFIFYGFIRAKIAAMDPEIQHPSAVAALVAPTWPFLGIPAAANGYLKYGWRL